ncbi:translation initiation factor IF-2 [Gammaproteobacteria bacterium]|nr:translation initiation factor IF-2 [Gammaproteobacteria bacterium]
MAEVTVKQLAETTGVPIEKLLKQMHEAGLPQNKEADVVSDEDKQGLLAFLKGGQSAESKTVSPKKITLKRRAQSTLKMGKGGRGVKVETRRKRTYVKRSETESAIADQSSESDSKVLTDPGQLQIEAERIRLEEERRQTAEQEGRAEATRKKEEAELREKAELAAKSEPDAERVQAKDEAKSIEGEKVREEKAEIDAVAQAAAQAQAQVQAAEKGNKRGKGQSRDRDRDRSGLPSGERTRRRELSLKKESRRMKQRVALQQEKQGGEFSKPVDEIQREVEIGELVSVGDLAQRMSVKTGEVIKTLMGMGVMATINQTIDQDTAVLVVDEMGHNVKIVVDDQIEQELEESLKVEGDLVSRSVVVTVMGHVDHGKTSLLDYIRKSRVVAGEAGGITQHIGAYLVETPHGGISFIDTPGHAAFTAMRARGAMATDVVILVCAADDGVMPQTEEAVQHAKAAEVPLVVAVNKIDLEGADPERVRNELAAIDVIPEEWGGDTQFVNVSAETGEGIEALLEAVNLQAEILELKAVIDAPGRGVVIESKLERGRGPVATVLVQNGTLCQGDVIIAGETFGKVRALVNDQGQTIASAGPSMPVEVLGLNGTPDAGDDFSVTADDRSARELAEFRADRSQEQRQALQQAAKLDNMFANLGKGEKRILKLVLKTDVRGSLEAITQSFAEIGNEEVQVNVLGSGVGGISESDATMAMTYDAVVFGFNVRADNSAKELIEKEGIELRYYSVIYELLDDVKTILEGMLAPEIREEIVGTAEVRDVFESPRYGQIAGCMVVEGTMFRNKNIRVLRENVVIYEGELESLRRFKDDVGEVRNGLECGIGVRNYNDVRSGDKIEVFDTSEVARAL